MIQRRWTGDLSNPNQLVVDAISSEENVPVNENGNDNFGEQIDGESTITTNSENGESNSENGNDNITKWVILTIMAILVVLSISLR